MNFFKRKSDGTVNAKVQLKTAGGNFVKTYSNSACEVTDWNGDGLMDILISTEYAVDNGGSVIKLFLNEGTATSYSFAEGVNVKTSDGKDISLYHRTNMCVADLNYDGKLDIILGEGWNPSVGTKDYIYFFENVGTTTDPSLKLPVKLQQTNNTAIVGSFDVKPYITDWNEDGGLDILLGHLDAGPIDIYLGEKPSVNIIHKGASLRPFIIKGAIESGLYRADLYLNSPENVLLQLLSVNGRNVETVDKGLLPAGVNHIRYNMNNIPAGYYLITIIAGEKCIKLNPVLLTK